jgi:hypothetical protein
VKRSNAWWQAAEFAYQYGAVSTRALSDELRIDRPYFSKQRDIRGWQIIRKPTLAELQKQYERAAMRRGYESTAAELAARIAAVKDAHDTLIRMVRATEQE